ncbi:MAG TPA: hypothetical protein VHG52_07660 [Thermomicrobiales bacterium]|nr:hypothetical protein [Thermomicrobiales bacterium]
MGFIDIALTVGLTSIAFLAGFCARGIFGDGIDDETPALEHASNQYEPPRRHERL